MPERSADKVATRSRLRVHQPQGRDADAGLGGDTTAPLGIKDLLTCFIHSAGMAIPRAFVPAMCGCTGLFGWWLYAMSFRALPGQDWMVFQTAVSTWLAGDTTILLHGGLLTERLNAAFSSWITKPFALKPWVYPPSFLLLFLPFGLLPASVSYVLFVTVTLLLLVVTVIFYERRLGGRLRVPMVVGSLLLGPATAWTVLVGQNAFLTTALLLAGSLLVLERRPVAGGPLLGLLTAKPQLWLMVPVMLLALKDGRAMLSCIGAAFALACASLAIFGPALWLGWFSLLLGHNADYAAWLPAGRLTGASITACAIRLGASATTAEFAQVAGLLVATIAVVFAFRLSYSPRRRLAVLLVATVLAAPHVSQYDMVMLGTAATLLFCEGEARGFDPGQLTLCLLLWVVPIVNPPVIFIVGAGSPLLLLAGLVGMLVGGRGSSGGQPGRVTGRRLMTRWRFTQEQVGLSA